MKTISFPKIKIRIMDVLLAVSLSSVAVWALGGSPIVVFILVCIGLIPLAEQMGNATETLAARAGPRVGGLLNATLGNAAELIITLVAIREGYLELAKASITGSIIGNLLLVLGASLLVGGIRNGTQKFSSDTASRYATLLALAVIALSVPSLFGQSIEAPDSLHVEYLSLGVAAAMILIYILSLVYSLSERNGVLPPAVEAPGHSGGSWKRALIQLGLATAGVVVLSEILVEVIEPVIAASGVSEFFLGIILVPVIGNVAEHFVAVEVAARNQLELSLEVALGSCLQIALLVAPLLVFASLGMGHPLTLVFNMFEVISVIAGVMVVALIAADGRSNWLEGSVLLAVYAILAWAFFLMPV
ncbi:MAG: calcium/proton exchanger [Anaerolineales bacterium]|nr:calcium/proton exchanger [Anaerolineales bacterium]